MQLSSDGIKKAAFLFTLAAAGLAPFLWTMRPPEPPASPIGPPKGFLEAEVAGILSDPFGFHGAVILVRKGPKPHNKALVVMVGGTEGRAIALNLSKKRFMRPLTHDLLLSMVEQMGGKVRGLYIHSMQHDTFFARLEVAHDGLVTSFDCRPSDGLAIVILARAPIWIGERVFDQNAVSIPQEGERQFKHPPVEQREDEEAPHTGPSGI